MNVYILKIKNEFLLVFLLTFEKIYNKKTIDMIQFIAAQFLLNEFFVKYMTRYCIFYAFLQQKIIFYRSFL